MFTAQDYQTLYETVFQPDYPGYKPEVKEAPNADGKIDAAKRYAHVAHKYRHPEADVQLYLDAMLGHAHKHALRVARKLSVPAAFMPDIRYGALRVLEYPVGAGSERHTDLDLFTLLCYRNDPPCGFSPLQFADDPARDFHELDDISHGLHIGEIGELVGLGRATPHWVEPRQYVQRSIVYFAIPDHEARLQGPWGPSLTVGEWLAERIARSRY